MLVAPLNWGIGHATRMVPLIRALLSMDIDVLLASDGSALAVLQQEFPKLPYQELPSYNIRYAAHQHFTQTILLQLPKIRKAAKAEHRKLKRMVKEFQIDAVISDSRIGLHHPEIPCVFVAHQLFIKMSKGKKWLEPLLKRLNLQLIENFNQCWIPDFEHAPNLSGELSHRVSLSKEQFAFIGPLSRLTRVEATEKTDLLVLLSGPEPQRTLLEKKVIKELAGFNGTVIFARGITDSKENRKISKVDIEKTMDTKKVRLHNYLNATEVAQAIAASEFILCRSGYSTLMDLDKTIAGTNKKVILVPTPGQTEQEYLASYFQEQGFAFTISQQDFQLDHALAQATNVFKLKNGWPVNNHNTHVDKTASESMVKSLESLESFGLLEQVLTNWKQQLWRQ